MADVSLDDLIKKDKEQFKANRANKKFNKPKYQKRFQNNDQQYRSNRQQINQDQPRTFKKKFIKKFENNKNNFRQDREQKWDRQNNRPPRQQRPQKQENDNKEDLFRTLKVMGLNPEFTNEDLYKLFATEGSLEKCLIEQDNFGRSLTTAIVKYHSPDSARSAIGNLNRHKIMNCVLTVQPYKNIKK